jgi:predicted lipoprotein with Yx(FWY)xxD motif
MAEKGRAAAMRRGLLAGCVGLAAAAVLAACGGGGGTSSSGGSAAHQVSTRNQPGIGTVLVDPSGKTLYFADQEASGTIRCTGACVGFWFPVKAGTTAPTADVQLPGKLGTVKRPDGTTQVSYDGKPLYQFKLDTAAGEAKGDSFSDDFGGMHFTWHAARTVPGSAGTTPSPTKTGYTY